jgi:hypothetical protein
MSSTPFDVLFRLADDQSFGSNLSLREISLSSNVKVLFSGQDELSILPLLGLLVLCAEDYSIGRIILPVTETEGSNPWYDVGRLQALCSSVNLEVATPLLKFESEPERVQEAAIQTFYRRFRPNRKRLDDSARKGVKCSVRCVEATSLWILGTDQM